MVENKTNELVRLVEAGTFFDITEETYVMASVAYRIVNTPSSRRVAITNFFETNCC